MWNSLGCGNAVAPTFISFLAWVLFCRVGAVLFFREGKGVKLRGTEPLGTGSLSLAASGLAVAGTEPCCTAVHVNIAVTCREGATAGILKFPFTSFYLCGFWLLQKLME